MKKFILFLIMACPMVSYTQVTDDFTDGDFTATPVWSGDNADFSVTSQELHLNNTIADDSHLMTDFTALDNTTWEFLFRWEGFTSTGLSSSNEVFFYLVANQNVAPETTDIEGYFVRIGNVNDEISLYRQDTDIASSGIEELIDGNANGFGGVTAATSGSLRIRVIRNDTGLWTLFADTSGGTTFTEIGTATDATYSSSNFAGIFIDYSQGNAAGYFFDDISISTATSAIAVDNVTVESNTTIRVKYNQDVDQTTAEDENNYVIDNSISVTSALRDGSNSDEVVLTVSPLATNNYQLTVSNVEDDATNTALAAPEAENFSYTQLALQSLTTNTITEIELNFNDNVDQTTAENIANYSIDNMIGNPMSVVMNVGDNSIVTLTLNSNLQLATNYTLTYGSINNSAQNSTISGGTTLAFTYVIPLTIDAVTVLSKTKIEIDFNQNVDQTTAETATNYVLDNDINNPISVVQNVAELDKVTLTLGTDLSDNTFTITINNVEDAGNNAITPGTTSMFTYLPLEITNVAAISNTEIEITFNQNVDETSAETIANYAIDGEVGTPTIATLNAGDNTKVNLAFTTVLVNNNYEVTVNDVNNTVGNSTATGLIGTFSFQAATDFRALVINEIFADPTGSSAPSPVVLPSGSSDEFIELYNAGTRTISIENFDISGGTVGAFTLAPSAYVILTSTSNTADFAPFGDVVGVTSWNGLTNTGETITLTDNLSNLVDSLSYAIDWYQDEAKSDGGWTLEQINPDLVCGGYAGNWIASTDVQGGTPGAQNAVYNNSPDITGPNVVGMSAIDNNTFRFTFDEPMDATSLSIGNYSIDNGLTQTTINTVLGLFSVDVDLDGLLISGNTYTATITGVTDCSGNAIANNVIALEYDIDPPVIDRIILKSLTEITVLFNEPLIESIAETESNFSVDNGIGNPSSAILDSDNSQDVNLRFPAEFVPSVSNTLSVINLQDLSNNPIVGNLDISFAYTQDIDTTMVFGVNLLDIKFNTEVEEIAAETLTNYFVSGGAGNPVLATLDASDKTLVHLVFGVDLDENDELTLTVENQKSTLDAFLFTPEYTFIYDTDAPELAFLTVQNATQILLDFNENLEQVSAETLNNYTYNSIFPTSAALQSNGNSVLLTFNIDFSQEEFLTLSISGIRDIYQNTLAKTINEDFIYDIFPPQIDSLIVLSPTSIELVFNEEVENISSETLINYSLDNAVGNPITATQSLEYTNRVVLEFGTTIPSLDGLMLGINNIADSRANVITTEQQVSFDYGNLSIGNLLPLSKSSLQISYNKTPDNTLASNAGNYTLNGFSVSQAIVDGVNDKVYVLTLSEELSDNSSDTLRVENVTDIASNPLNINEFVFEFKSHFKTYEQISSNTIEIEFEVNLDANSASLVTNYSLTPTIGNPAVVSVNGDKVRLVFSNDFELNTIYNLSWSSIFNEFNNRIPDYSFEFCIDDAAPVATEIEALFGNFLTIKFDEGLRESTAENEMLYFVDNGIGNPSLSTYNESDSSVLLAFSNEILESTNYIINIDRVEDLAQNQINNQQLNFTYTAPIIPTTGDIIITEIMADPTPIIGLPELEYVEIYNNSANVLNLSVVNFSDEANTINLGNTDISPSQYLILTSDANAFSGFGNVLEVGSFPSISNSGETLSLSNSNGDIIDEISFETAWYRDAIKDNGGYSLERIFFTEPCLQEFNWIASTHANGGTPGSENSVFNIQFDTTAPQIESVDLSGNNGIIVHFDEILDSLSLENGTYIFSDGLVIQNIVASSSGVDSVLVTFTTDISLGILYDVTISDVEDCGGNAIESSTHNFGIGKTPVYGDLLFTEIMTDPSPVIGLPEEEFIEIYNNSNTLINLNGIQLADASDTTELTSYNLLSGSYIILTSSSNVGAFSPFGNTLGVTSFPSLSNTADSLYLFLADQTLINTFFYKSSFYRDDEKNDGGYSLERIFFEEQCTQATNWIASTHANGGTPGVDNSVLNIQFDTTAPQVERIELSGNNGVVIHFDEVLDSLSLANGTYNLTNGLVVDEITLSDAGVDSVLIAFTTDLVVGTLYNVTISGVADCAGNALVSSSLDFGIGKTPVYGDLLFTEIMPDPSPAIELPEEEFIELYNNSGSIINLEGIQLADASDTTTFSNYLMLADSYLILSSNGNVEEFSAFGNTLGVTSFPSLSNTADSLYLFLADQTLINTFFYKSSFYRDDEKNDGGYSLERIFFEEQCTQATNWIASTHANGGTPGVDNSVLNIQFDTTAPQVDRIELSGNNGVVIHFNEVLDSLSLANGSYVLTNGLTIQEITVADAGVDSVLIAFTTDLVVGTLYNVTVSGVADCAGNSLVSSSLDFGIGKTPVYGDLLFTEIMPDPSPAIGLPEEEFIELYNNSGSIINLEGIQLADASDTTTFSNYLMLADSYLILSSNGNVEEFSAFGNTLGVTSFPSLSNTADSLYLFLADQTLINTFFYKSSFYRDDEKNDGGYSLERIFFEEQCTQATNWIASTHANGGTPGVDNSVLNIQFDTTAPEVERIELSGNNGVVIHFDEVLDSLSLANGSYVLTNGLIIQEITVADAGVDSVQLTFTTDLVVGTLYNVTVSGVADCAGNALVSSSLDFGIGKTPVYGDLLFTEIMPDPSPAIGLPEEEFIELYNNSGSIINLEGIQLADASDTTTFSNYLMLADSYLILSSNGNVEEFSTYGNTLGVTSFPSLSNTADSLYLFLSDQTLINTFFYKSSFYRDDEKNDGGYSLERIFFEEQCTQATNWIASTHANGGTPGVDNSVLNIQFDTTAPQVDRIELSGNNGVVIHFNEVLDSLSLANGTYTLTNDLIIQDITVADAGVDSVQLTFTTDLVVGTLYNVTVSGVADCAGNALASSSLDFGIGKTPVYGDLLFTEIMPDPSPAIGLPEEEFIELYNNSGSIINLEGIQLADASDTTTFSNYLMLADSYLILSSNGNVEEFSAFGNTLGVTSFPSLSNTADSLYLFLSDQTLINTFFYKSSFYRDDEKNDGGYSLERIFFEEQCTQATNWIASTHANGGTPGVDNSVLNIQFDTTAPQVERIELSGNNGVVIHFDEVLDSLSLANGTYNLTNGLVVDEITVSDAGVDSVLIAFTTDLVVGTLYNVTVSGVADCAGNALVSSSLDFGIGKTPVYGDLLFTEIMPDPSPAIGLPEEEFIELYNNSGSIINLEGIQLADASDTTTFSNYLMLADSYLILSSNGNVEEFSAFGNTLGVTSFPSLSNTADSLYLFLADQTLINTFFYKSSFYRDDEKNDGGYSLERIFFEEQCLQELNWIASIDESGGSPGAENSVLNGIIDTQAPEILALNIIDNQSIELLFSEPMDSLALLEGSYVITGGLTIDEFLGVEKGGRSITISFTTPLVNGTVYNIDISNLSDCAGNSMNIESFEFGFGEKPGFNELIITEIMADPDADADSEVSLPSVEYLELYNPTDKNIELADLTLQDGSSQTTISPYILFSKQYLLLVPRGNEELYPDIPVLGVKSWPSLNNGGEVIALFNESELVFSLEYNNDWYKDSDKTGGGFSLEMIDTNNPCGDINNWTATVDTRGGTPGKVNSVATNNPDSFGPKLIDAIAKNSTQVTIFFDEKLNPSNIQNATFTLNPNVNVIAIENDSLEIKSAFISLVNELDANQTYSISVGGITDCLNNEIQGDANSTTFILPEEADSLEIIINEVLFNPRSNGVDFVEIYNHSNKAINLKNWQISSINDDNELVPKTIADTDLVINPESYRVLTTDPANIKENYPGADESTFVQVAALSAMANDEGTVILLDSLGNQIDRFDYNEDFHFNLLDDVNGVSLERINFESETNNANSWQSAASTAGFATPGLLNSQFKTQSQTSGTLTVEPKVFVPDNTGMDNFTTINYDLSNAGNFANILIYNHRGQLTKTIAEGELLSTSGFFTWDGTNNVGERASFGYYVIYFEIYDSSGNTDVMKETIVLGTRF